MHSIAILIASLFGLLMWMDSAHADPAAEDNQPAETQTADTVAEVIHALQEMDQPADAMTFYSRSMYSNTSQVGGIVTGNVQTDDGTPLPDSGRVWVTSEYSIMNFPGEGEIKGGSFSVIAPAGKIWVNASAPGWASSRVGPLRLTADKPLDDVSIILSRGIEIQVHVVDPDGNAVAGAEARLIQIIERHAIYKGSSSTDVNGVARMEHVSGTQCQLEVNAKGYSVWSRPVDIDQSRTIEVCLAPIPAIVGTVVKMSDGTPIANAAILAGNRDEARTLYFAEGKQAATRTDKDGHFRLAPEQAWDEMTLAAITDDGRFQMVRVVRGQPVNVRMPEPLHVRGRITGDFSELFRDHTGQIRILWYDFPLVVGADSNGLPCSSGVYATEKDGSLEFELNCVTAGKVRIQLGRKTIKLDVQKSIDDLIINLDKPGASEKSDRSPAGFDPATMALTFGGAVTAGEAADQDDTTPAPPGTRRVVVQFIPPAGSKQAEGVIKVDGIEEQNKWMTLKDGRARFDAPLNSSIYIETHLLPGAIGRQKRLTVAEGSGPMETRLQLYPAGAIRCRVVDGNGQPVSMSDFDVDFPFSSELKDQGFGMGTQVVRSVTAANEVLLASMPLNVPIKVRAMDKMGLYVVVSKPLVLTAQHPVQDVELQLVPGQSFTIHLRDPDGKPMVGQPVALVWEPAPRSTMGMCSQVSDGRGDIQFDHLNMNAGDGWDVQVKGQLGLADIQASLKAGKPDVTLQPGRGLQIRGSIIDAATGRPLFNVPVHAFDRGQPRDATAFTNEQGEFVFDTLLPGVYQLSAPSIFNPVPRRPFLGIGYVDTDWPKIKAGQKWPVRIEVRARRGEANPYPYGDSLATQPATQPTTKPQ